MTAPGSFWWLPAILFAAAPGLPIAGALMAMVHGRFAVHKLAPCALLGAAAAATCYNISFFEQFIAARARLAGNAPFSAFVFAGFKEESAKILALLIFVFPVVRPVESRRLVLSAAMAGLGFAISENVILVLRSTNLWEPVALMRAASAVPMHVVLGLYAGCGLAQAKTLKAGPRARCLLKTLLVAAFLHGNYDLPLFLTSKAPAFPIPLRNFAAAFYLTIPTFLGAWFFIAIASACAITLKAFMAFIAGDAHTAPPLFNGAPPWPARVLRLSRPVLSGLFGVAAAVLLGLSLQALALGTTAPAIFPYINGGVMFTALTLCLAIAAGWSRRTAINVALIAISSAIAANWGFLIFERPTRNVLATILMSSAQATGSSGDLQGASVALAKALELVPDDFGAFVMLSQLHDKEHRYEAAYDDLTRALAVKPGDSTALLLRSSESQSLHNYTAAIADLDQAISTDPKNAIFHHAKFGALAAQNQLDDAAAELDKAASIERTSALLLLDRAQLAVERNDPAAAKTHFDNAVRTAPALGGTWAARGRFKFNQGDFKGAAADLATAVTRDDDPYIILWLGIARARTGANPYPEIALWSAQMSRSAWPAPIIDLFLGRRPLSGVIKAARTNDERCEALFYGAEWLIQQSQPASALTLLVEAAPLCPLSFVEHDATLAEIGRLNPASTRPPAYKIAPVVASPIPPAVAPDVFKTDPPSTAFVELTGGTCHAAGTGGWHLIEAGDLKQTSVEATISLPDAKLSGTLRLGPLSATSSVQIKFSILGTAEDGIIDEPTALAVRNATSAVSLPYPPFKRDLNSTFSTKMPAFNLSNDFKLIQRGQALELQVKTKAGGDCVLSIQLNRDAKQAIRAATADWLGYSIH